MDLGIGLEDDDIFDSRNERTKEPCLEPYTAKQCPNLWFNTVDTSCLSNIEAQTIIKYRGDMAYQEQLYEKALVMFEECQGLLQPNNVSMRRGVEEDKARCHLRLGQLDEALDCARNVETLAQNFEQVTAVLVLLLDIYEAAGKAAEMLCTVKKLLLLHPNNAGLWIQLGDLYFSASAQTMKTFHASGPSQTNHTCSTTAAYQSRPIHRLKENSPMRARELGSTEVTLAGKDCEKLQNDSDAVPQNPPSEDRATNNPVCDQNGSMFFKMNEQSVAGVNADHVSGGISDQLKSLSCHDLKSRNDAVSGQTSEESDRLLISLTSYTAARQLLRSVYCRLNSFAKAKNKQEQLEVESRLESLLAQSDMKESMTRCCEFLRVALNLTEADESIASTNNICDMTPRQILCEDERTTAAFDMKWFSWMKQEASSHDQFQLNGI